MRFRTLVVVPAMLLPGSIGAQTTLKLDLGAEAYGGTLTENVRPGLYAVSITNRLRTMEYNVSVLVRDNAIEPLDGLARAAGPASKCLKIAAVLTEIADAEVQKSEKKLSEATKKADAAIKEDVAADSSCQTVASGLMEAVRETIFPWPHTIVLAQGQQVEVTVTRTSAGADARTWKKVFTTGAVGEWRVTYGYAAHFNAWGGTEGAFAKRQSYYSAPTGSKFLVSRRKDRGGVDLTPAILYHFMPAQNELKRLTGGWTAGIGTDLKDPLLVAGYSWTYWQNLSVQLGLLARRERQLLAKYAVGDTIASELSFEQLTEPAIRIRPHVAITLRFGTNPFAAPKAKEPAKEGPENPEAKKPESPDTKKPDTSDTKKPESPESKQPEKPGFE